MSIWIFNRLNIFIARSMSIICWETCLYTDLKTRYKKTEVRFSNKMEKLKMTVLKNSSRNVRLPNLFDFEHSDFRFENRTPARKGLTYYGRPDRSGPVRASKQDRTVRPVWLLGRTAEPVRLFGKTARPVRLWPADCMTGPDKILDRLTADRNVPTPNSH